MMDSRGVCTVLVGKPEENRPLERPRHRWEDNIKIELKEVGSEVMDWVDLAQGRNRWRALVNAVMNIRTP
jgi:ribosome biogenesis protein Nip4